MNQPRIINEATAFRQFESRLAWVWTGITYVAMVVGLWRLAASRPDLLRGWSLVGLIALLGGFYLIYHLVYMRGPDEPSWRWVVAYGLPQAVIVTTLLGAYTPEFFGLGLALAIQLMAVLPARFWLIPAVGLVMLMSGLLDLVGEVRQGNTDLALSIGVQVGLWLGIGGVMIFMMRQRLRLAELVEELRLAQEQLRRAAAQANELATLRERTRLAREMHDSLGHALVTVNVKLEVVERLYARDAGRGVAELRATRDLVRQAMVDLRHSLDDLRGPLPASRDLPVDVQRHLREFQERTRIVARGEVDPDLPDLPPEVIATLWATLQEALRNVERHAGAASVEVSLLREGAGVRLRVADDGAGLTPCDLARAGRHGVAGMRERIEEHGGELALVPRPGGGVVVEAALPLAGASGPAWDRGEPGRQAEPLPAEPLPAEPLPAEPLPAEPLPAEPLPARRG